MPLDRWLHVLRLRVRSLARGRQLDHDLDDELRYHVEELTSANVARGMSPADARRAALIAMDSVEVQKEKCRDARGIRPLDELASDLRYAWRMCTKDRGTTIVAVLSLALAIGANTAIFSLLNSLLLRALPVQEPERLVIVSSARTGNVVATGGFPYKVWDELQHHGALFDGLLAWAPVRFNLSAAGETQFVDGLVTSGSYFRTLGVPAIVGRTFTPDDDVRGGGPDGAVAVISYGLWQRRFGGDAAAIGRALTLEGVPFTIVGVTPPDFFGPEIGRAVDITVPLGDEPIVRGRDSLLDNPYAYFLTIMARLKPGQTADAATTALRGIQGRIREATLPFNATEEAIEHYLSAPLQAEPAATGTSALRGRYERPLMTVMAVVVLVLLIACANIANLLLARASARRHELTVRIALGASRHRLLRQLLTESFMLSAMGALAGAVVAAWSSRLIVQQLSTHNITVVLDLSPDWRVLLFTAFVTVATTLLFGVAPALRASAVKPIDALKDQATRASGGGRARFGPASALVVAQVAISLVLVVAAGLFIRTFSTLATRQLGFDRDAVLLVNVHLQYAGVPPGERLAIHDRLRLAVRALPDVSNAAQSLVTPVSGNGIVPRIEISDALPQDDSPGGNAVMNLISPGWFGTYGTALRAGRDFDERDTAAAPAVAIVNETLARTFLGNASPLGHTVTIRAGQGPPQMQIVGVVADAAYRTVRERVRPTLYVPLAQYPNPPGALRTLAMSVRAKARGPERLTKEIAAAVGAVNPHVALTFLPLATQVDASLIQERIVAMLSGFFGALALLLAGLGLYGVTSYAVTRRRAEIGIRMALGAAPSGVVRLVLWRVSLLVGAGVVVGAVISVWASQFIAALLYGLEPRDPATFAGSAAVLVTVGALAGWLPARRAAQVDPAEVLRES